MRMDEKKIRAAIVRILITLAILLGGLLLLSMVFIVAYGTPVARPIKAPE